MKLYAKVIIDISADAVDRAFTYSIPDELLESVVPGACVQVPFGNAKMPKTAYVIEVTDRADYDEDKIKPIIGLKPDAVGADRDMIALSLFMAKEYGSTLNQALKTALPIKRMMRKNSRRKDPVKALNRFFEDAHGSSVSLTDAQERVLMELLSDIDVREEEEKETENDPAQKPANGQAKEKERAQANEKERGQAKESGHARGKRKAPKPSLLFGVTGSGKTLIYIRLIEYMQSLGRASIVLIPEISLTYQTVRELSAYFGDRVAVLHSRLSEGERYEQYMKAAEGEVDVMVGPRSAVFAPFENLGLIVIDEEHERAYQSDTTPRYDVREVAIRRAEMTGAKLLLGSATPSVCSYERALKGEYRLHTLKERAVKGAKLPTLWTVDLREELAKGNRSMFSEKLYGLMKDRLQKKEQIMLFLNRRGYAGFVSCRSCGYVAKCARCDVSMTAHNEWYFDRKTGQRAPLLSCHYCGSREPMPKRCPSCGSPYIAPFGTGTQKLEQAVRKEFPKARLLRMDADTTAKKGAHEEILAAFSKGEADILIGTQMIVKGHDFPRVTLVGIVAADLSLYAPEFDAAERTFQLLQQAAGRAGRGRAEGDVVIQSYDPSHYAVEAAAKGDYEAFYEREMSYRRLLNYPPSAYMLSIRFQAASEALLTEISEAAAEDLREAALRFSAELIGPCKAGIYKLNDNYRKILYIKHENHDIILKLRDQLRAFVASHKKGQNVYLNFDLK